MKRNYHEFYYENFIYKVNNKIADVFLIIYDKYFKIIKYIPVFKMLNVSALTDIFMRNIVYIYEKSKSIVSNRNSIFINLYGQNLYYHIKIKYKLNTAFHPQINH